MKSLISFFCILSVTNAIPFQDCGSEYQLKEVEIENCKYLPCPLFMNGETKVNVKMEAGYYSESLEQDITVSIKGIKFTINSNPEPCTKQRPCPIEGTDASFSAALEVPELVPFQFSAVLTWIIKNNQQKTVMCFSTNVMLCEKDTEDSRCYH